MKFSYFLVVILVATLYLSVAGQKFADIVQKCKTAENATDNDFLNLKNNVKPRTKVVKCLNTCISENNGLIKNQKLNPEGTMAYIKTMPFNNDKVQQSVKEILEVCKAVQDPDRCEFGDKVMGCLSDGAAKQGIKSLYPQ